jgi:hypothetical protein
MLDRDSLLLEKAYRIILEKTMGPAKGMNLPPGFVSLIQPAEAIFDDKTNLQSLEAENEDEEVYDQDANDVSKFNEIEASANPISVENLKKFLAGRVFDTPEAQAELKKNPNAKYKKPLVHASNIPIKPEYEGPFLKHKKRETRIEQIKAVVLTDANNNPVDLIDVDEFKKMITERPDNLLATNGKMMKSAGSEAIYYNTTLPALKGLVVNESTGDFLIVTTCPHAGKCMKVCYAMLGNYLVQSGPTLRQTRILNYLMNDYEGYKDQLQWEIIGHKRQNDRNKVKTVIRFNDSGDMISEKYIQMAMDTARSMPNILFYAYTKEVKLVKSMTNIPDNFVWNYSFEGNQDSSIDRYADKHSDIIPRVLNSGVVLHDLIHKEYKYKGPKQAIQFKNLMADMFKQTADKLLTYDEYQSNPAGYSGYIVLLLPSEHDKPINNNRSLKLRPAELKDAQNLVEDKWDYNSPQALQEFKQAIAKEFKLNPDNILSMEEMFQTPIGQPNQYVVIVLPGEADVPATRKDVLGTYLYVHGTPQTGIKKKKLPKPTLDETPPTPVKKKKLKTK